MALREDALALSRAIRAFVGNPDAGIESLVEPMKRVESAVHEVMQSAGAGRPAVLQAPSVWHALAFLLFQFLFARHRRDEDFRIDPATASCFGSMGVFRGQAVPWPIMPTLWRADGEAIRRLGDALLTAFARFLDEWLATARDGRLHLFESLSTLEGATATAQHYRFPTNYVDFTFDPLTALHFACGSCDLRGDWPEGEPTHHAVIYMAGFRELWTAARVARVPVVTHLPPVQVARLYDQSGFFVDFGSDPATGVADVVQSSCARLYFPRTYPELAEAEPLRIPSCERDEPFFSGALRTLRAYGETCGERFSQDEILTRLHLSAVPPPWAGPNDIESVLMVDTWLLEAVRRVRNYLLLATCMTSPSTGVLDPVIISTFAAENRAIFDSVREMASWPGEGREELGLLQEKIDESLQLARELVSASRGGAPGS